MAQEQPETDPLADLFDGSHDLAAEVSELSLYRTVQRATRIRRWAAIGGALLLVMSLAPIRLSPLASIFVGAVGLSLVTFGCWFLWRSGVPSFYKSRDEAAKVLAKALVLSQRVSELDRQGRPLTDLQRKQALTRIRQELGKAFQRSPALRYRGIHTYVPELPLPPLAEIETRKFINDQWNTRGLLRVIGPAWLTLAFVVVWTSVFMVAWGIEPATCQVDAARCSGAFQGLSARPAFGDFTYLTINAARGSMPSDITAKSRIARIASVMTFVSAAVLLANYATALWASSRSQILAARAASERDASTPASTDPERPT